MNNLPMSKETHQKLVDELAHLKSVERPSIIEQVQDAREQGDLKENAEYHAAREKQGHIEDKIAELQDKLMRATIIDHDTSTADRVTFGAKVTVKNQDTGKELQYTLVSPDAVDVINGLISNSSPIGKALMGQRIGDIVEVNIPKGLMKLEILAYE